MKAFPVSRYVNVDGETHDSGIQGMDLRDYFAAKIMQSLVLKFNDFEVEWDANEEADIAYSIADAMMKAREQ